MYQTQRKEEVMEKTFAKPTGIYFLSLILMLTLFVGIPFGAMAADTVKIGVLEAFSGVFENLGRTRLAGIQFAVDQQNAKGGLLGKEVEIIREDGEFKPDVGIRKAQKLMLENKIDFLTSGMGSHTVIALNKLVTASKVLFINHTALSDDIQGKEFSPYGFRVCQNVHNMNTALLLLIARMPYRRFYLIDPDYAPGYSGQKLIKEMLKTYVPDSTVVGADFYPLGVTRDFGPYITKIIAAKADAVINNGFSVDLINFVKQARSMGLKRPFPIFSALSKHPYIINDLKDDAQGVYWVHEYSMRVKTPENEEMIRMFHEKHKDDKDFLTWWPTSDCAMALLGWKMTFSAIEKAGSLNIEKIITAFENFQWKSPVGLWTMRKCDHQVILPMFGGVIEGGPNPFYKFPWAGPNVMELPTDKVAKPATSDYNPRCQ